jgi:hypothetical protein
MKSCLLVIGLLLFASGAQAQHSHSPVMAGGNSSGPGFGGGGGWGSGGAWGSSPWGSDAYGSSWGFGSAVRHEAPREHAIGSVQNDGEFVPSTFMNYDEALRLGQQQLAAEAKAAQGDDATPSLGEAARAYRALRVPTLRLQIRALQDNAGRLQICNLNGNDCHRP